MQTQPPQNKHDTKWDTLIIGSLLAFIALSLAIIVLVIAAIMPKLGALPYLQLIKDLALIGAVAFPAYAFVHNKAKAWRILYWICITVVVIAAIFGNMHVIG